MKKRFISISIMLFQLTAVLYADDVEKVMKEVRLAYKELKKEVKSMDEDALKDLLAKMNSLGEKMKEVKIEENQEKFNELSGEFRNKIKELNTLAERKDPEEFRRGINELINICVKCHRTFVNPVKRFFMDLFL